MGDINPGEASEVDLQTPMIRGRSVGQKMALFMVPLLAFFLLLMGGAAFIRAASLLQAYSQNEMTILTRTMLNQFETWTNSREIWLHQADAASVRQSLTAYLNKPGVNTRQAILQELQAIQYYQDERFFSEIAILRIDSPSPSVLISTNASWETSAPPSFIGLPENTPSSLLLFDEPVISPGGLVSISSLPMNISGNDTPDLLILGICTDDTVSSLLTELQQTAKNLLPDSSDASTVYLAFRPDRLVPIMLPEGSSDTQIPSPHPAFSVTDDETAFQAIYQHSNTSMLTAASWRADDVGIILDTPRASAMQNLYGLGAFLTVLVFIGALLSTIVVILAANQLLNPLRELVGYAQEISKGNWNLRLDESGTDEFGTIAHTFNQIVSRLRSLYQSLEARVEDRTRQIRTASEVARTATSSPSLEDLLHRAVNLIADRFGYSSVSIFLLDQDGSRAVLKESSSDTGQALIAKGFSTAVNADTIIGWVASATQLHLSRDILNDQLHIPELLVDNARAETALPLQFGGRVLGVLDVQSNHEDAFPAENIEILHTLADELSAAIHNASLAQASATIAARARLITQITGRLGGVLDVDQVLETTADALHSALGNPEVLVRLNPGTGVTGIQIQDVYHPTAETLQTPLNSPLSEDENSEGLPS